MDTIVKNLDFCDMLIAMAKRCDILSEMIQQWKGGVIMACREIILQKRLPALSPCIFGYENCVPDQNYGPGMRDYWLLHYVVSGFGNFLIREQNVRVSPGEIFIIPPGVKIEYRADSEQPWSYIWIGFHLDGEIPAFLKQPSVRCPGAGQIFQRMKACSDLTGGKNYFLSMELMALFSLLEEQNRQEPDYVEQAISLMQAEYDQEDLSVQGIAIRLGLDRSYFSNLFRSKTGMPPGQYLSRLRLERAAEMLASGYPPTIAGSSCGFSELAYFSRRFKVHFGCSPRAYMQRNAESL